MRSPSLATIVRRALAGEAKLARGSSVLVAVSGGPDSMALLDVMAEAAPAVGVGVVAHGVDHGLRREAASELDLAAELARSRGVPFERTRVEVARGGNLQARARTARWSALATAARAAGATAIATAHHADDRAETLLMRMLRGAGARGLAVLPARAPAPGARDLEVVRPMLRARRVDGLRHLARHAIPYATDPSNDDPRFLRTRVRKELMPLLEELGPGIVRHLEGLADELQDRRPAGVDALDLAWTSRLPRGTQDALHALVSSRSTTARVWLPGGVVASVDGRARSSPRGRAK